ncbi:hypothetical protein DIPPA_05659 [Diplonema papillatum]|nr:hypothetical protein DIPPA_05659 [Diplonema papillatum]|eukprot:gene7280-11225_t
MLRRTGCCMHMYGQLQSHMHKQALRHSGVVASWKGRKGYLRSGPVRDIRADCSELVKGKRLRVGCPVEFDLFYEEDGPVAKNITGPYGTDPL